MKFIELHDVGYGECIVFEGKRNEILMVDCGSMNIYVKNINMKFKDYVTEFLMPRYNDASKKSFLLTHFHRDHICGLKYILKKDKDYFDRIYIPNTPISIDGRALLLEMAVYAFTFLKRQKACTSMSTSAMFIFSFLSKNSNAEIICTLKKGDIFEFSDINYEVLNPVDKEFAFSNEFIDIIDKLDLMISKSSNKSMVKEFFRLKDIFCEEYINCINLCTLYGDLQNEEIKKSIANLNSYVTMLSSLSKELEYMDVFSDIVSFLDSEYVKMQYSKAQNSSSIVFQNCRQDMTSYGDIIMTGDVTNEIFDSLANELFKFYNVIKVPHHGTSNYQSEILNEIECSHMLISNGDYHAGGKISKSYFGNKAIKHCTNKKVCDYYNENESCCNRLLFCESLKSGGELSTHCFATVKSTFANKCGVYVVSVTGDRGCYCE